MNRNALISCKEKVFCHFHRFKLTIS